MKKEILFFECNCERVVALPEEPNPFIRCADCEKEYQKLMNEFEDWMVENYPEEVIKQDS